MKNFGFRISDFEFRFIMPANCVQKYMRQACVDEIRNPKFEIRNLHSY